MTREEAIKEIKSWDFLDGKEIEAIQTLIPELEENEDEKIIMTINNILPFIHDEAYTNNGTTKKDVLNWLEKQKEYVADNRKASTSYDDRIRKAIIKSIEEDSSVYEQEVSKEQMIAYLERQKETGIRWLKSDNVKNPDKPYIDKAGMFYTTDGRMCYASEIEKREGQKPIECIEFANEFDNQVSHLLASVLNGEHEYNKDFVKYAAQSLLGYAKNELKSDELNEREKLMKALQTTNAQIGELVEENYKLKEQKPAEINEYEIIKKHITEDFLSSEVNKRLKECGWYVTDEKPAEWSEEDEVYLQDALWCIKQAAKFAKDENDMGTCWSAERWLKALHSS